MVILRPTRKLQSLLRPSEQGPVKSDTALGDWYVNRVVVDRRPLLLLISSTSLLPILIPARDVRELPARLATVVAARLGRLGLDQQVIDAETDAMSAIAIAPTVDRSVLGVMVDFAKAIPYHLEPGNWNDASLTRVEDLLAETPCHASQRADRVVFPDRKAPELLIQKWLADRRPQPTGGRSSGVVR